jgi:mRNA interferase RelE/StbE
MPLKMQAGMSKKYKVVFEKKYEKDLKYVHSSYRKAIIEKCFSLGDNPRPDGYLKLKGADNLFRIRVGPYRIIYTIQDEKLIVLVLEIGDRKDIYKDY